LLERLRPAIGEIASALEDLNQERQRPVGRLWIYAVHLAAPAVIAPIWERFLSTATSSGKRARFWMLPP
jgi:DNA-binding transcriptional LysR family regulator